MPIYDTVAGVLRQAKPYVQASGALSQIKESYDLVAGVLRKCYSGGTPLTSLPLGSTVQYLTKSYTLIAFDYCVAGDAILWCTSKSGVTGSSPYATNETPFGESVTNLASIAFHTYASETGAVPVTKTGYGWIIPCKALGGSIQYGSPFIPYFSSDAKRSRGFLYMTGDNSSSGKPRYVDATGALKTLSMNNPNPYVLAYSVLGSLTCTQNEDGTYTLQI